MSLKNKFIFNKQTVLSPQDAAELCYVSARTIRNWIKFEGLKFFKTPGGQYKIRMEDLKDFIKKKNFIMADLKDNTQHPQSIKKILIVDDDEDIVNLLKLNLINAGFEIETASNGIEAGTRMVEFKPDLIILDIIMPEMDGLEALKYFRESKYTKDKPVIILTSVTKKETINKAMALGATSYLTKPVKIDELIIEIQKIINKI